MLKKSIVFGIVSLFFFLQVSAQLRQQYPLDQTWNFRLDKPGTEWEEVTVPHCWNATDGMTPEYYRGTGEYRYQLNIRPDMLKKRAFLRFEAASLVADVFLNGTKVGTHSGGFNAFCFEITPYLKKGENLLEVKVSNSADAKIIPLSGDFTVFGGIYRPVSLLLLPQTCVTPLDYASSGVYIHQKKVSAARAELSVVTKVNNDRKGSEALTVKTSLFDAQGKLVGNSTTKQEVGKGETVDFVNELTLERPILWEGKKSPYQYRLFVEVMKGNTVVDTLSQYTGLRYFTVDAEKGFILNGKSHNIRGVNRHQDRDGKGWAISKEDQDEDMEMIKEIGANGVRLAHYPHSDYFYSLCDKEGLLVWAEIPLIGEAFESDAFTENAKQQLTELIRQNFNHPSIFCWSLFNELCVGEVKDLVVQLNTLAHQEDPGRPTVAAANVEKRPENTVTDIMAYNTYPGWYWAEPSTMNSSLGHWNRLVGSKGIAVSEYGAGANPWHHWQKVSRAPKTDGTFHPEEWQSLVHEGNYQAIHKSDFVWGSFVWNMFDFASATRNEGNIRGLNDKGLVTYDRKIRKDAFYYYKSIWSEQPVLHLTSKRDVARIEPVINVKVYSNCNNVRLKVNGKDCGEPLKNENIYIWKEVSLQKGENKIEVAGSKEGRSLTDACNWVGL